MKKPWNKILPFLIPSVCVTSAVAIPAIVLMTTKHVVLDFDNQRFAKIQVEGEDKFIYSLHLVKKVSNDTKLYVETPEWFSSDGKCYVKPISNEPISVDENNNFKVEVQLIRKDGKPLTRKDFSIFSLKFKLNDAKGKKIWTDSVSCIRLRYEPKSPSEVKPC